VETTAGGRTEQKPNRSGELQNKQLYERDYTREDIFSELERQRTAAVPQIAAQTSGPLMTRCPM
jgi:hypothetical protein